MNTLPTQTDIATGASQQDRPASPDRRRLLALSPLLALALVAWNMPKAVAAAQDGVPAGPVTLAQMQEPYEDDDDDEDEDEDEEDSEGTYEDPDDVEED
jgi:hypothetical protein